LWKEFFFWVLIFQLNSFMSLCFCVTFVRKVPLHPQQQPNSCCPTPPPLEHLHCAQKQIASMQFCCETRAMSSFGGGAQASSSATLGKRIQVVARVRKELTGETIDSDLNVSGNGCKITLVPPAKSKSDRRTEFLFDDVFVPDCRPEDL
jgi:hypothetical protein